MGWCGFLVKCVAFFCNLAVFWKYGGRLCGLGEWFLCFFGCL